MQKRLLACGLGGGLDVLNASILHSAARAQGTSCALGSVRPAPQDFIYNHNPFSACGTLVDSSTYIQYGLSKVAQQRYCQPLISKKIGQKIFLFSRKFNKVNDPGRLAEAIQKARSQFRFTHLFFMDGGGDSLIFNHLDAGGTSDFKGDVFSGGDAVTLAALQGMSDCYLCVVAAGLDIDPLRFKSNVQLIKSTGGYLGRVNLFTFQKEDYKLGHLLQFKNRSQLDGYFWLAKQVLNLAGDNQKVSSHTATVAYHALHGHFQQIRTYVPWQPQVAGTKGVKVEEDHAWLYFFIASTINFIKKKLQR